MLKYNVKKDSYSFEKQSVDFFINIGLQVTRRCNLKCIHCCEPEQLPDVSLEQIKNNVDKLSTAGLKKICITGGEPFLRKDLADILKYIHDKKIYITFSTNGSLLDKSKLADIKPYIDNIRFSLHGMKKTHEKITLHKGSFEKVLESIHISRDLNIPVSVVASIFSPNHSEMFDIAKLCENLGVAKLYFFSLISRGRGSHLYEKGYVSFEELQAKFNEILGISQKESWDLNMNIIDWSKEGQCVLLFPNGDLVGVPSFNDKNNTKVIGNLTKDNPGTLWDNYIFKDNYIAYYKLH